MHKDKSTISVNIALNPPTSFTGGGTFFPDLLPLPLSPVVKPPTPGSGIIHLSSRLHAGVSLTSGVRSILVIFVDLKGSKEHGAGELQDKAKGMMKRGAYEGAIELLNESLSLNPTSPSAYHLRSSCHLSLNSLPSSLTDIRLACSLSPSDARCFNDLGVTLQSHGSPSGARGAWREAIRLLDLYEESGCIPAREAVSARLNLAVSMSYLDDYSGAASLLLEAKKLCVGSSLALPAKLEGDVDEMLEFCRRRRGGGRTGEEGRGRKDGGRGGET
ncbi:hypothetical protein TrRE_jg5378 [Triparma retinervis]|uniref:Uncharacterized protein n=1 Tax=Triparma retinervis TaxID=2557542 RepID=A0A9W7DQ16_9STRA|nr:hypothetical protein TrRE_jg5378 [Triparma retinervis]